jgi:glucose/arabinose dehydrogenase
MALRKGGLVVFIGLAAAGVQAATDLGTYNGCAANDGQFTSKVLSTTPTPPGPQDPGGNTVLKMAFAKQADGTVDVYFVQKRGPVKRYNAKTNATDSLGIINADFRQNEYGLLGIATRNDFLTNPWLYFYYSFAEQDGSLTQRVSRIKLTSDMAHLDMTTEKVLIKQKRESVTWHTAGAMKFDDYGDLWVAFGDNQQTDAGPGNTADLRGGIVRIHPDESAKGYSIPAGNFGAYFHDYYTTKGQADLAAKYLDTNIVKPEIFIKGTRNAYSIYVDPVKHWVAWGDVGPDQQKQSEEYNLFKNPVFAGWPYYAGAEDMFGITAYGNAGSIAVDNPKTAPLNNKKLGIVTLPPVSDPIFARAEGCAMTGPIFRYDGRITTAGQIPPQMNGKWLITGCDGYGWHLRTLNATADAVSADATLWGTTIRAVTIVDVQQGPDGVLYYVDYGKGTVNKVEYTGTCKDPALIPDQASTDIHAAKAASRADWLSYDRRSLSISAPGAHKAEFLDMQGRVLATLSGTGPATHAMPQLPAAGVYRLRVQSSQGEVVATVPWIQR